MQVYKQLRDLGAVCTWLAPNSVWVKTSNGFLKLYVIDTVVSTQEGLQTEDGLAYVPAGTLAIVRGRLLLPFNVINGVLKLTDCVQMDRLIEV